MALGKSELKVSNDQAMIESPHLFLWLGYRHQIIHRNVFVLNLSLWVSEKNLFCVGHHEYFNG
jgi:hypothetical protein